MDKLDALGKVKEDLDAQEGDANGYQDEFEIDDLAEQYEGVEDNIRSLIRGGEVDADVRDTSLSDRDRDIEDVVGINSSLNTYEDLIALVCKQMPVEFISILKTCWYR